MDVPAISDASESIRGVVHQLWVALEKCFELGEDQCLLIEKEGDVSIPGVSTTEVKLYDYDDDLTDGHLNVWKTLRNWMDLGSNQEKYAALILRTNQSYGTRTRFKGWNEADTTIRIEILTSILADSDSRLQRESEKRRATGQQPAKPSESHAIQRAVLDPDNRERLQEVVSKFTIADESLGFQETYNRLKVTYCGHIPELNQEQYLGALIVAVIRPGTIDKNWTITRSDFNETLRAASARFSQGNKRFPQIFRPTSHAAHPIDPQMSHGRPFVAKILEIEHNERIPQAIRDYHETQGIILRNFRDHAVEYPDYKRFAAEVEEAFVLDYSIAKQQLPLNSKLFYDKTIRADAPHFPGFEPPPREFKNGVLHMHLDNESKQHKWKLTL